MNVRILVTALLFTGAMSTLAAQPLTERFAPFGTVLTPQFASAPFPHPKRAAGHTYGGTVFPAERHYSDSTVLIVVPKGYVPHETVDIVLYLHGWYNSVDSACAQFRLIQQFAGAKKNAIFVFPEGPKHAPDSFGGKLEEADGLKELVADVFRHLKERKLITHARIGRIVLAGHSGAYRAIAFMLLRGGMTPYISDVILFDALYGQTEKYAYWLDHYKGRFVAVYTDSGGTKGETENLMADLDAWKIPYRRTEDTALTPAVLRGNRLLFIHTALGHNDVIATQDQFRDYLSTSTLRPLPRR